MSAAANRAEKLEHQTDELTQPAATCIPGDQKAPLVIEVARGTGTNLGAISNHGTTPLMRAACDGLAGTVRALLDRGADVNAKRSDGFNALALAAFFGHAQVVWILLENSADLAATGRSETPPEMWADARGFFEIGDTLRNARVTEQVDGSSLSTAVIAESDRFSRPTENAKHQRVGDPSVGVEAAKIDEATDSEVRLAVRVAPVAEESTATLGGSTVDILPTDKPGPAQQEPVIEQPLRAVKTLPEIEDPPPLAVPRFHPGSAFVARIASSRKNLLALILAVLLGGGGIVAFRFPQIRRSWGEWRREVASDTTNLPTDPSNPVADSGTRVLSSVETPSAPETRPTSAPAANDIEKTPAGTFAATTSMSRPGPRARKHRAVSQTVTFKQATVAAEQSKPAPLSWETSRSRSVLSTPVGSANEVPSRQPPPLTIISGRPKSKVIQWP
jgi:hypothetical protein